MGSNFTQYINMIKVIDICGKVCEQKRWKRARKNVREKS